MRKFLGLICVLATAGWLTGCATGDPRLQGTWKSNKVPMPTEMVKVTKMQTVKVRKGSKKTKKIPKTVMVAKTKSAPAYIDLILRYSGARVTFEFPAEDGGRRPRITMPYQVAESDEKSVTIDLKEPSGNTSRVQIFFDGPNRYWVNPVGGEGWKEYYDKIESRG